TARLLVVDESFADPVPELSVAATVDARPNLVVLRSFGKFYGLAGLRLGFALGHPDAVAALSAMAGPWPVSGPAIAVGRMALADRGWRDATVARLAGDCERMDLIAAAAGWRLAGGCHLFRLYGVGDAVSAQGRLAEFRVWSRRFGWSNDLLRL